MEYKRLGDYCTITSSKRIFADQYVDNGVPFYRSREIIEKNNNSELSEPLFISKEVYDNIRVKFGVPKKGDMLLTSVGTIGIPYIVKDECFYFKDGNLTWMKDFSEELSSQYMYYWISSKFGRDSLMACCIGSSQSALTIEILKKYKFFLPDRTTQDKIVAVLSNYNSLIELNNKRIKALEQMTENLYKEWFVRFRFPGHESAEFENGIPKGWIHCKFNEIYNTVRGVSYSSDEIDCDEGMDLINLKNIQAYGGFRKDGTKKYCGRYKSEQIVEKNSLVMGVTDMTQERRTVGSVALVPDLKGVISADLILLQSEISNVFSYYHFKVGGYSRLFSEFGNGANVIHLKPELIRNQKILVPTNSLVNLFEKKATRITDQINNLEHQIDILIKQRDLLLPRLMNGKLEV